MGRGAAEVAVFESVGFAIVGDDFGMVDEELNHRTVSSPMVSPQWLKGLLGVIMTLARS